MVAVALKIIVADDHPMFRIALRHALQEVLAGGDIIEAASLSTLEAAAAAHPDAEIVLLDLHMPGAHGFSALVFLRAEYPELPVVVISSNDHPRTVRRAQQFGAAAFIPKSATPPQLSAAITTVLDGGSWFPAQKAEKSEADSKLAADLAQLTPAQIRVLMCIADGKLNKQIAYELDLAENTVKVHVTAVLRKLNCYSRTQAAVMVKALTADDERPMEE